MTLKEKILYHQIHPLKLLVDISTSSLTTYFAWRHDIFWFLILFLLPSAITSFLLVKYADLERIKQSCFGNYIGDDMTKAMEVIRFGGQIIMWIAAWFHFAVLIVVGGLIILGAWLNDKIFK